MLTCEACGTQNVETNSFCVGCGATFGGGGFTQVLRGRRLKRRVYYTEHVEIHTPEDSFADRRAAYVGTQLESLVESLVAVLDMPQSALKRVRVSLAEVLPDPQQPDQMMAAGTRFVPATEDIYSIYRPDAPGVNLDYSLLRLLVWRATGNDVENLPQLWIALLNLCTQRAGQSLSAEAVNQTLLNQVSGHRPSLTQAWAGAGTGSEHEGWDTSALLSFLGYLLDRGGGTRLREFVTQLANVPLPQAVRAVYGASLPKLERAWWQEVRKDAVETPSGVGPFLRGCIRYLRPYGLQFTGIFLLMLVQLSFQQVLPQTQQLLINDAIIPRDYDFLTRLGIILSVMIVAVLIAGVVSQLLLTRVSEGVIRTLRERLFSNLQFLSHRFYSQAGSADIITRFTIDLRSMQQGLSNTLTNGTFQMISLVASAVHILLINVSLGLLVIATLPVFYFSTRVWGPPVNKASLTVAGYNSSLTTVVQEDIAAQPVVKAYNLQPTMINRFREEAQSLYRASVRLDFLSAMYGVSANFLTSAVQVTILILGGYLVMQDQMSVGSLFSFFWLANLVIYPVQNITGIIQSMQIATVSMNRIEEVLNATPEVRDIADAARTPPLTRGIRFEDVSFSYRGDTPQLDGINLEIQAGQSVAFVGPSGSGKSTIINMIMRFYDPNQGRVLIDGFDARHLSLDSLRRQIGIVFQESFLFNTSVRENIRYGRLNATDEEVEEAAKAAEIHEAITQLPHGYDTVVGERGGTLSGGQRQRLAIARAIVRSPSILLLDEATSALDPRTENAINHTLATLAKGRTTVSVTHRLSMAMTADRIFVLDKGRLVEQGSHAELLAMNGLYRGLHDEQTGVAMHEGGPRTPAIANLRAVPIFSSFSDDILLRIAPMLRSEQYQAGAAVTLAGDQGDKLYIIQDGELDVLVPNMQGREQVLTTLSRGDYFGEIALLRDIPRSATVRATTPVQLLSLDRDALGSLFEAIPYLRDQIEATIAEREAAARVMAPMQTQIGLGLTRTASRGQLEARDGVAAGQLWLLKDPETGIGRNPSNDVVLASPLTSGFHARIVRQVNGRYVISDSGSTNGTWVNSQRVVDPVTLDNGDAIFVGGTTLIVHDS